MEATDHRVTRRVATRAFHEPMNEKGNREYQGLGRRRQRRNLAGGGLGDAAGVAVDRRVEVFLGREMLEEERLGDAAPARDLAGRGSVKSERGEER